MLWKKLGVVAALGFFVYLGARPQPGVLATRPHPSLLLKGEGGYTSSPSRRGQGEDSWHTVTRVIDGDTIEIETGERVRYIGMNSPETADPRRAVECFGKEASAYNHQLVEGKEVSLFRDVSDKDKYGRLLRYVYLPDGTFVNLKLVEEGYASVMTIPPNVAKAESFRIAEREARENSRGLWGACR